MVDQILSAGFTAVTSILLLLVIWFLAALFFIGLANTALGICMNNIFFVEKLLFDDLAYILYLSVIFLAGYVFVFAISLFFLQILSECHPHMECLSFRLAAKSSRNHAQLVLFCAYVFTINYAWQSDRSDLITCNLEACFVLVGSELLLLILVHILVKIHASSQRDSPLPATMAPRTCSHHLGVHPHPTASNATSNATTVASTQPVATTSSLLLPVAIQDETADAPRGRTMSRRSDYEMIDLCASP